MKRRGPSHGVELAGGEHVRQRTISRGIGCTSKPGGSFSGVAFDAAGLLLPPVRQ